MEQFQRNSSEILGGMRYLEEFCDVTLVSEDNERIRAHKVVLASASAFFRDMFQTEMEEDEYQVICMKGVNSRLMTAMVNLVYDGETEVKQSECEEFLNILRQYGLLKVKSKEGKSKIKCKFFNKGFCMIGPDCAFNHPREDCENHMLGIQCKDIECEDRHRQICKYWKSNFG